MFFPQYSVSRYTKPVRIKLNDDTSEGNGYGSLTGSAAFFLLKIQPLQLIRPRLLVFEQQRVKKVIRIRRSVPLVACRVEFRHVQRRHGIIVENRVALRGTRARGTYSCHESTATVAEIVSCTRRGRPDRGPALHKSPAGMRSKRMPL